MSSHLSRLVSIATVALLAAACGRVEQSGSQAEVAIEVKEAAPSSPTSSDVPAYTPTTLATPPPPSITIILSTHTPIVTVILPTIKPTATFLTPTDSPPTETPEPVLGPLDYPTGVNPLTGKTVPDPAVLERRPLAIKISNYPRYVRPQSGLDMADMVWEHYAEGGTSRYTAVYYAGSAERVGPIRSARLIDLTVVDMLDSALVASGTSKGTLDRLWQKPWYPAVVTRANGYKCPPLCQESIDANSMFTSTAAVWQALSDRQQNTPPTIQGLVFHNVVPPDGQAGTLLRVDFSQEAHSEWHYNNTSERYERWIDASANDLEPHIDAYTDGQIAADNLAVLFANHVVDFTIPEDFDPNGTHATFATEIQLWGSGQALLFRDGQTFVGSWVRSDAADMPSLVGNYGNPLPLRPGKTWVYTTHLRSDVTQADGEWTISHRSPSDRGKLILTTKSADG